MSYDTKCYDLAEAFLEDYDTPHLAAYKLAAEEIAQAIQSTIEDALSDLTKRNVVREKSVGTPWLSQCPRRAGGAPDV